MFPFGKGWKGPTWLLWCVSFSSRRRQMGKVMKNLTTYPILSVHIFPSQTVYSLNNSYILMSQEHSIHHPSHWLLEADDLRMSTGSMSTFLFFSFFKRKRNQNLERWCYIPSNELCLAHFQVSFLKNNFGNLLGFTLNMFVMFFMFCKITSSFFNHNSILFTFICMFCSPRLNSNSTPLSWKNKYQLAT